MTPNPRLRPGPLAALLAVTTVFALSGCASNAPADTSVGFTAPSDSNQTTQEPVVTPTPTPTVPSQPLPASATYSAPVKTGDGFDLKATFTVYPAVRGTDGRMTALWSAVGGTGDIPCLGRPESNDSPAITAESSAFAFGTLTITDSTPNFSPPSHTWQIINGSEFSPASMGLGFSNGAQCNDFNMGGYMLNPNMTSTTWGPVPVVFAFPAIYTPAFPTGDTATLSADGVSIFLQQMYDTAGNQIKQIPITLAN